MPTQILQEVDNNFIGVNSRLDPSNLQPGFVQASYNMRLQRGTAQPRKGCKRLTDSQLNSLTMVGSGTYVNDLGQDNIVMVFTDRMYLLNTETGLLSPAYMFPSQTIGGTEYHRGISYGGVVDVVQALDKLYIFRGQENDTRCGTGGTSTTAGINLTHSAVSNGSSVTVTATWVNTSNFTVPTLSIGDEVTVFNITDNQHASFNNTYIVTSVNNLTSFTFVYTNNTGSNINSPTQPVHACLVRVKPPLVWNGRSSSVGFAEQKSIYGNIQSSSSGALPATSGSVPPADFGFYFQNRIVAKISDTGLAVGDILSELFDFTLNNFIVNQGGNDSIVGVLPWVENQFLVFMKRSIYVAYVEPTTYVVGAAPGLNSSITVVTTQIGCLSRRSITSAGQFVYFLSGKGVHMLTPQLDLKLIGNTLPLSESIDDFFDNVNFQYASSSVSSYYDNRFFIAVPTGTHVRPNAVLVYNTLNQQWESIDTYPDGMLVDSYAVCQYGRARRQFILCNFFGSTNVSVTSGSKTATISSPSEGMYVGMPVVTNGGLTSAIPSNTTVTAIASNGLSFTMSNAATGTGSVSMALSFGGVFVTEEYDGGDQFNSVSGTPTLPFILPAAIEGSAPRLEKIDARIRSREYTFDSVNTKQILRAEYQFNNSQGDFIRILARAHDPDAAQYVFEYEFKGSSTFDSTVRPRIALNSSCIDMEVQFVTGRPALKTAVIYAIVANRSMISDE